MCDNYHYDAQGKFKTKCIENFSTTETVDIYVNGMSGGSDNNLPGVPCGQDGLRNYRYTNPDGTIHATTSQSYGLTHECEAEDQLC